MHSKFDVTPLDGCGVIELKVLRTQEYIDDLYHIQTF